MIKTIFKNSNKYQFKPGDYINDGHRNMEIIDVFKKKKKPRYSFKCYKCGWENGEIDKVNLMSGQGCGCCAGNTTVAHINDISTTAPWMEKYFFNKDDIYKYSAKSNRKALMKCPYCDAPPYMYTPSNLHFLGHLPCNCLDRISVPEKFLTSILQQANIVYIPQFNVTHQSWCEKYRYDFYLPDYNCIIETHGMQHYNQATGVFGSNRTVEEVQINDKNKYELAIKNGVTNYICIDCRYSDFSFIKKSIINSQLLELLNIAETDIDWNKCAEFSTNNIAKECAEKYKKGKSIYDLAKEYCLSSTTIKSYINSYMKIDTSIKKHERTRRSDPAPFKCIYNNKEYYFESKKDVIRNSFEKIGIQITSNALENCMHMDKTEYKGVKLIPLPRKGDEKYEKAI